MTGIDHPPPRPTGPVVVSIDEQHDMVIDADRWATLATNSLMAHGVRRGELNLLFVDEHEIRLLNLTHMNRDRPTDVLSFPLDGSGNGNGDEGDEAGILIGDVVICPSHAAHQAPAHLGEFHHDGSLEDELALLVVHGVLHVLGWDHEDPLEADEMSAAEQALLSDHHRS